MVDFALKPNRTALVNIDFQNCFVEGAIAAAHSLEVLERVNQLGEVCRKRGVLVIHALTALRPDGSNLGVMGEIIPQVRDGMITDGSPSAELHQNLLVEDGDIVLKKVRFGAFHGTDLELILRTKGIDSLIISGLDTNICCDTTAREANVRDFRVFFLSDGTSTYGIGDLSAEEIQRVTCATLGMVFAQVLSVAEMIRKIKNAE